MKFPNGELKTEVKSIEDNINTNKISNIQKLKQASK
jgi:hypothetical protein